MRIADFTDYDLIPEEHRTAVESCIYHNLMNGKDNGAFDPHGNVTYGEFCKLICVVENLGRDPYWKHTDENLGNFEIHHWAASYIQKCREQGIYKKNGDEFHPNQSVIYSDVYDMLSATYRFMTGEYWRPDYSQAFDTQVTRSGIAVELFKLCQAIGRFLLIGKEPYFIPSASDLDKYYFFLTFLPANYSNITYAFNFAFQIGCSAQNVLLEPVYSLLKYRDTHLVQCNDDAIIYHFTSLSTLKALSTSGARFRLSNAEFLNDTSEGQILMRQIPEYLRRSKKAEINPNLKAWLSTISTENIYKPFRPNSTYIASFLAIDPKSSVRNLPMWYTYADNCKGCAIRLDVKRFGCPLYKVNYSSKEAREFLEGYINVLNGLWKEIGEEGSRRYNFFCSIALDILTQCSYLFKDRSFSYECEARAIIFCSPRDAEQVKYLREGELFARTYCEVPFQIDHVIFGPAVPDPKRLAVGLAAMGLDCTFEKSDIPFTVV
ncbi:S-layer homology domain-containing protein [Intestinimonas timonensis]|uniref:S-layer homology domain-containing protein n=1 Tax=Intestinimonas timonensis TaxID=1689270 RepID=UPI003A8CC6DB